MTPPAPPRFSTKTVCRIELDSATAINLPMPSAGPPGGKGINNLTGLLG